MTFDLESHLKRQMAFSRATFGPGERREGVADHIRKELDEIEASNGDPDEWADVVILALDGLWRSLSFRSDDPWPWSSVAGEAARRLEAKQAKNEQRNWPDWRTADPNKAIEHDRSGELSKPTLNRGDLACARNNALKEAEAIARRLANDVADAALNGLPEQARIREGMESAATKIADQIANLRAIKTETA